MPRGLAAVPAVTGGPIEEPEAVHAYDAAVDPQPIVKSVHTCGLINSPRTWLPQMARRRPPEQPCDLARFAEDFHLSYGA